jgi:Protein of unknown function (DUF2971)
MTNILGLKPDKEAPATLYHYTTWKGLLGIIESRSLWATNISFLNDRSEFRGALRLLENRVEEWRTRHANLLTLPFRNAHEEVVAMLTRLSQSVYVTSFSTQPDQLGQWRGYCSDNNAFSIGFDAAKLEKLAVKFGKDLGKIAILGECIYGGQQKETKIDSLIETSESSEYQGGDEFRAVVAMGMIRLAPLCKDLSFQEEDEWRLVIYLVGGHRSNVKFRDGNGLVIPYYEFNVEEDGGQLPITSVKIGPVANADEWEISLKILLAQQGVNATVSKSIVPYRPKL